MSIQSKTWEITVKTREFVPYKTDSNSYRALMNALSRKKSLSPGLLATFYLDVFLEYRFKISSESVINAKLCDKNEFSTWRDGQQAIGFLDWDIVYLPEKKRLYNYRPGPKLSRHLDKISTEHALYATKSYVKSKLSGFATKKEMLTLNDILNNKIEILESKVLENDARDALRDKAINFLIEKFDPPYDEEKKERYLRLVTFDDFKEAVNQT